MLVGRTVTNLNDAAILALSGTGKVHLNTILDVFNSVTFSQSRLFAASSEFPYVPALSDVLGVSVHSKPVHGVE